MVQIVWPYVVQVWFLIPQFAPRQRAYAIWRKPHSCRECASIAPRESNGCPNLLHLAGKGPIESQWAYSDPFYPFKGEREDLYAPIKRVIADSTNGLFSSQLVFFRCQSQTNSSRVYTA